MEDPQIQANSPGYGSCVTLPGESPLKSTIHKDQKETPNQAFDNSLENPIRRSLDGESKGTKRLNDDLSNTNLKVKEDYHNDPPFPWEKVTVGQQSQSERENQKQLFL